MEGGSSVLCLGVVEAVRVVFITVVGPQVEVVVDLHLLGEMFEDVPLKEKIADGSDGVEIKLGTEVVEDVSPGGSVVAVLTGVETEVPSAHAPTRTSKMSSGVDLGVFAETQLNASVSVLTRKSRSWSSWISPSACCLWNTSSASRRLN